jgi:prolyl 4-hydroxylase
LYGSETNFCFFKLTDVTKGGGTVFPFAKVHVPARKGTAAFWYNLRSSGEDNYYTRHAACPVLLGNKWVGNKWIHEVGQEFRRLCEPNDSAPTEENEPFERML